MPAFRLFLVVLLAATCSPALAQKTAPSKPAPLEIVAGPYLQAPSETGMTIVWATNRPAFSRVEYSLAPDGKTETAASSRHGLVDPRETLHVVPLTGLKPGTAYRYRALSTEGTGRNASGPTVKAQEQVFTTVDPRKESFSLMMLNDQHDKVARTLQALKPEAWQGMDLVFYNGDTVDEVKSEAQVFQNILVPSTAAFADRIPLVFVRGNHDTRGGFARAITNYFPADSHRWYYTLDHGGVRIVVLDCGEDKADSDPSYRGLVDFERYLEEETRWLAAEVRSEAFRKARFRIVITHIPPMPEDQKHIRGKHVADRWEPLWNEGKVDLLLAGHTHVYAAVPPRLGKNRYQMVVGSPDSVVRVNVMANRLEVLPSREFGAKRLEAIVVKRQVE